jgi:hypothetical protein
LGAVSLPENIQNMNVWCVLTHERVIGQFFFDEDIITSNSFLDMLEKYDLLQLNNNNLVLKRYGDSQFSASACLNSALLAGVYQNFGKHTASFFKVEININFTINILA